MSSGLNARTPIFVGRSSLRTAKKKFVDDLVSSRQQLQKAYFELWFKAVLMVGWLFGSYAVLWTADHIALTAIGAVSFALAICGVAFNVGHDFGHGAGVNTRLHGNTKLVRFMDWAGRATFDMVGASSYVWKVKHATAHHTYTNIDEHDADVDQLPFMRLHPNQSPKPWMRYQHIYGWFLYGLLTIKWQWFGDFENLRRGRIASSELRPERMTLGDRLLLYGGKLFTLWWFIVFPLVVLNQSVIKVIVIYLAVTYIAGVVLAIVFQLAHAVDGADFVVADNGVVDDAWEIHQIKTTRDFHYNGRFLNRTVNRFLNFSLGGLDRQTIHHIFPKIPHTMYRHMGPEFEQMCSSAGVTYVNQPIGEALKSHARWLKMMGRTVS